MKRTDLVLLCIVFLLAFALRFYDVASPAIPYMDESGHVPAATNYWDKGQFELDRWEHPPLRHTLLYGFLQVFGNNPYGWRMRNVLFGSVTAVLVYLFAFAITPGRKTALLAGLLIATDPLHVVLSRHTFCEVYGTAFFVLAIVLYVITGTKGSLSWTDGSIRLSVIRFSTAFYGFSATTPTAGA